MIYTSEMSLAPQATYRISINSGQPEQKAHADVQALVDAHTPGLLVMTVDQSSGWQDPSAFGIVPPAPVVPVAPTTPASPTAPVTPTTPTVPTAPSTPAVQNPATANKKDFFTNFAEKIICKIAEMTGNPNPLTGKQDSPQA